jgi:hypothetical protein
VASSGVNCLCGCCGGTAVQTPLARDGTLPGQSSVPYRVGTWSSFRQSMLARLSSADYPALANLRTRDSDDFSIALIDAAAVVLDVLSFYQERLANEGYLGTAQQPRSLTELSRLVGYQPSPGVAAATYAAFTLKSAPGQTPDPTSTAITIPQGTQLQSVPPQGQTAQTFETSADIVAKPDWNALAVQTSAPWVAPGTLTYSGTPGPGNVYLSGTATQLNLGDSLLILGVSREIAAPSSAQPPSSQWGVVTLTQVRVDAVRNLTYVEWAAPLPIAQSDGSSPASPVSPAAYRAAHPATRPAAMSRLEADAHVEFASAEFTSGVARTDVANYAVANSYVERIGTFDRYGYRANRGPQAPPPLIGMTAVPNSAFDNSPWTAAKVFAFRQKGALFGYNAPNPNLFATSSGGPLAGGLINATGNTVGPKYQWNDYQLRQVPLGNATTPVLDLDATYPKAVVGSWFALVANGAAQLYRVAAAQTVARSDFGLSGKVTELVPDYAADPLLDPKSGAFPLNATEVWLQSDQLTVAPQPLTYPLYGALIDLQVLRPDLVGMAVVALRGKQQKFTLRSGNLGLHFIPDDGTAAIPVSPGDVFTLVDPAALPPLTDGVFPDWTQATEPRVLYVQDVNGRTGQIADPATYQAVATLSQFDLTPSVASDPWVSEYARVSVVQGTPVPYAHTQIQLLSALSYCYERASTTVNANVALVTHGQSVSEILGSGNASTPNQSFVLRQSPLTFTQAPTPSGRQSTLDVQANGVSWSEVDSLCGAAPTQTAFEVFNQSNGSAEVVFGDGDEGALLPTGQNNLIANYRIGLGAAGNVAANTLTTLIDRPLGVSAVTNPETATGGQDADTPEDIRSSAPLAVLTLGRAVSLVDYANYAANFAGMAKAHALWMPSGPSRGVFLTVAGVAGAALPQSSPTLQNLLTSLQDYGNPLLPLSVQSFIESLFGFTAKVKYDPSYQKPAVTARIQATLAASFGFARRDFGQGVTVDEISTVIQNVPGVIAVTVVPGSLQVTASSLAGDLAGLAAGFSVASWKNWVQQVISVPRPPAPPNGIAAYVPVANAQYLPLPAEILVIDPDPSAVTLGVLS